MNKQVPQAHSIQAAADLSGLPATTLRYYEELGLLGAIERDPSSGHRRYSDENIDVAIAVACLGSAGMSIEEMRSYLTNRQHGDEAATSQIDLLERQQRRMQEQAAELQLRQRYIDHKLAYWRARQTGDQAGLELAREHVQSIAAQLHAHRGHTRADSENQQ